jgi:replicative DNA helicase
MAELPLALPAEEALLGACLLNANVLDAVADRVAAIDFYRASHARLFTTMLEMRNAGEPVDVVTVGGRFPDLSERLYAYVDALPTATNAPHYAEMVHDAARLRRLIEAGKQIVELGEGAADADAAVLEAEAVAFAAMSGARSSRTTTMAEALSAVALELEQRCNGKSAGHIESGIGLIDSVGALERSGLVILAARPGVGKTSLALQIAHRVACDGGPVLFASLEMVATQLAERLIESRCHVGRQALLSGNLDVNQQARLAGLTADMTTASFVIDDSPVISVADVRHHARRLALRAPLSLVVVDYVQLLHTGRRSRQETREREVAEIAAALKTLARELDCPVLALSQLNRAVEQRGEDAEPRLSDLRESGSLEQDADMVIFLWPTVADVKAHKPIVRTHIHIAKHRNGPTGKGTLDFERVTTAFHEVAG